MESTARLDHRDLSVRPGNKYLGPLQDALNMKFASKRSFMLAPKC